MEKLIAIKSVGCLVAVKLVLMAGSVPFLRQQASLAGRKTLVGGHDNKIGLELVGWGQTIVGLLACRLLLAAVKWSGPFDWRKPSDSANPIRVVCSGRRLGRLKRLGRLGRRQEGSLLSLRAALLNKLRGEAKTGIEASRWLLSLERARMHSIHHRTMSWLASFGFNRRYLSVCTRAGQQ